MNDEERLVVFCYQCGKRIGFQSSFRGDDKFRFYCLAHREGKMTRSQCPNPNIISIQERETPK